MKLTVETIRIQDLQFGEETCFRDGILYVNKEDILAFAASEPCFETLKIDISYPGDSTRIINVVDVVQPRCKVSGNIDWPGVLTEEYEEPVLPGQWKGQELSFAKMIHIGPENGGPSI